jgi:hypothetical protein
VFKILIKSTSCLEPTSVLTPRALAPLFIDSLGVAIIHVISILQTAPVELLTVDADWKLPCRTCVTEDTKVHVKCSAFDRLCNIK